MKAPLGWLKEFIPVRYSVKELAHRLTMSGLEVEHMEEEGDDVIFTLGITPNRGDCLSILGLAREVSALRGKRLLAKTKTPPRGQGSIKNLLKVVVQDRKGCPRYMARIIQGLKIGPSPDWMQKKLLSVGLRPVNNVVDCTNYVMWELGQPLHAFDYRFLRGKEIVVRSEPKPFKFVTLDGVERHCLPSDLFICDGEGPVALAGVMGGANSEVRDDTDTVVLEAAYFDPKRIHATSKRLQLKSESSRRFERGVDPNNVSQPLHRLTELILETAGGIPSTDWIDVYPQKITPKKMTLPFEEVKRVLGMQLSPKQIKSSLDVLGFGSKAAKGGLQITVPTFRPDVARTIDLVEEVARLHGYDKIPATFPKIGMNLPKEPGNTCAKEITAETLTALGYTECCHLSFTSPKKIAPFYKDDGSVIALSNPLSEDYTVLRPVLIPSLLDAVAFNQNRQRKDIRLFELRKVFCKGEQIHLGVVATGEEWPQQWGMKPRRVDLFSIKGALSQLADALHREKLSFEQESFDFLVPTASCSVLFQGKKIGWLGLIDPAVLKNWGIETDIFAAEIEWETLSLSSTSVAIRYQPLSKYPYIERDIALIVDNSLTVQKMIDSIRAIQNEWIQKVQLFDLFRGGSLPQNKKSLAFNICYASCERTLTNEEVNEAHQRLITHLEREIGAILRK